MYYNNRVIINEKIMQKENKLRPYFMWLLPLSFFAYQFILRLWPSLTMQQIMESFVIDATSFGFLASVYYYGYATMQIPIAIMLDRYGPRYVIFICALICGLAMFIFTYTNNWYLALLGRFLIGVGSVVGFLGTSKVISQWFTKDQYSRMVGFTFTIGLTGAIYGGRPISLLMSKFGWQNIGLVLACISVGIGLLALLFLSSPKQNKEKLQEKAYTENDQDTGFKFSDLFLIIKSPSIWLLAIANLLMVGSLEGFADVWGVNYMVTAYKIEKSDAASLVSFVFIGMLFGGPILSLISRRIGNYTVIGLAGMLMALVLILIIYLTSFNWFIIASLLFVIGIMCCYQVIVFAIGAELMSGKLLGVTIAFLNCINMLGGSFFHTVIGVLMDRFWQGTVIEGVREYPVEAYSSALIVIPLCAVVGSIIVFYLRTKRLKEK